MLLKLQLQNQLIYSYMEYDILNMFGFPKNDGEYLYIRDLWVHPKFDGKKLIMRYIKMLEEQKCTHNVKYIYWQRQKRDKKLSRAFTRETCLKHVQQYLTPVGGIA